MRLSAFLLGSLRSALFRFSGEPNRVVIPDIRVADRLDEINENFRTRGQNKHVDIEAFRKDFSNYEAIQSTFNQAKLEDRVNKSDLELLREMEQKVVLAYLKWPNDLLRPSEENETVHTFKDRPKFDFKVKSHLQISDVILSEFGQGNLFYLGDHLAECELNLLDLCENHFCNDSNIKCKLLSCPDVVRSLVLEGCGHNLFDSEDEMERPWLNMRRVQEFGSIEEGRAAHLVGGSSVPAMVSFLAKTVLNNPNNVLPLTYLSLGRHYESICQYSSSANLFNSNQTSAATLLSLSNNMQDMEKLREELLQKVIAFYTELDLHFCVERVSAPSLFASEMEAYSVLMYSPFEERAVEVGRLSVFGNYLSNRLMIKSCDSQIDSKKLNDVFIIGGTVLKINPVLAAAVEDTQNEQGQYSFNIDLPK